MKIRSTATILALFVGLGLALSGCSKLNEVRAMKAFKDGNKFYAKSDWRSAAEKYEEAIKADPNNAVIYFYLANSYDNMYRPTRKGEPQNDAYLEKAIENYKLAADRIQDPKLKGLSLQYLVAAYRPDYFALAKIYEDSGEYELAEETFQRARDAKPNDPAVYLQLAGYYSRQGDFEKTIAALNERIKLEPNNPEAYYTLSTYYWDEAYRDFRLDDKQKLEYVLAGIDAVNKAIEIKSDYMEAIAYKNLLLRLQANLEKDPAKQQALLREADELRDQATELRKQKASGVS
jgi:tetratricopeptide (TPR) repeat protein